MLRSYEIQDKPSTSKNPQANATCERVHLAILNVIRCHDGADWNKTIHYAVFAVRASYHSILNDSPGQLLFSQDMVTRQLFDANWSYLSKRRFDAILADNDLENSTHFYNTGDNVMLRVPKKFRANFHAAVAGPFFILQVHSNGTVTIDRQGQNGRKCEHLPRFSMLSLTDNGGSMTWVVYLYDLRDYPWIAPDERRLRQIFYLITPD